MSTIRELFGQNLVQPFKVTGLAAIAPPVKIESSEMVGIEIEVENVPRNAMDGNGLNRVWQITGDGSLRNNGAEFITRPIMASDAPRALEFLLTNYLGAGCCYSPRTSTHVHLNMQDFTETQVYDTVLLYTVFEKLFFKFAGRGRAKNIYCVPLYDTDLLTQLVEKSTARNGWSKYTSLNLLPLQTYGTIEFRHMHGTRDTTKLSLWIALITKLKEYVRAHSTADIRSDIARMDDGYAYDELLKNIFGPYAEYLKYEGLHEITYLPAKQALTSGNTVKRILNACVYESDFFKFKGQ